MASFAIEVPGEANPLSEATLVHVLRAASSSNQNQVTTGTKQLQQWEASTGFYQHLQSAFLDRQLPFEVRYLAIIQLKNGIDKYWRRTARNAVSNHDKEVIRNRLVHSILTEEDDRLALQDCLVTAKIARFEFPQTWPEALSAFVDVVQSDDSQPFQIARALLALLRIVKELSTARLQQSRQAMQKATPEMVGVVGLAYARIVSIWLSAPSEIEMQLSLLALKLLRKLLVNGYETPNRDEDVKSFWSLSMQHLSAFIAFRKAHADQAGGILMTLLEKHILQLAKLHHEMAQTNAAAFALLPSSVELTKAYWGLVKEYGDSVGSQEAASSAIIAAQLGGGSSDEPSFDEKIALQGLLLVRACVKMVFQPAQTFKYRTPQMKEEKKQATEIIKNSLLDDNFVRDALETCVFRLFIFRASELQQWNEEPDEWEQREDGSGYEGDFSVRPCAEKLFLDLSINYKDVITQPLLNAVQSITATPDQNILHKDAIFSAVGLAAPVLHEHFDFDAFIRDVLVQEVQKETPGANILRRRIAIVLGQWITIRTSASSKSVVYEIFQHLLNSDDTINDQVVRITAGRHFADIANDMEFSPEKFLPYSAMMLTRLLKLIEEVELPETKLALVNTVSVIVERLDHHITPYADSIVNMLPSLWAQSEEENLMRQAILTILTRLINAMRSDSLPLHALVIPIISVALQPGSDEAVYLLEDALELLAAVLAQTPDDSASPDLLQLLPQIYPVYEFGTEGLAKALEITDAYVVLAPSYVLSDEVRMSLFVPLGRLLGEVRAEANGPVCNIFENILRAAESLGGEQALAQITSDLFQAGVLPKILTALRGSWAAHCTTGPRAEKAPVDGIVETDYLALLARLVLGSINSFCHVAAQTADSSSDLDHTMKWLLEEWFSHFESIADPGRRKLMCLALTKLLETNASWILVRLQSLITVWTDVISELREDATDDSGRVENADSLVFTSARIAEMNAAAANHEYGAEAPEDARRRTLTQTDPVHTIYTSEWVKRHLQRAIEGAGGEAAFQQLWLVNVDRDVLKAFAALGIM